MKKECCFILHILILIICSLNGKALVCGTKDRSSNLLKVTNMFMLESAKVSKKFEKELKLRIGY